MAELTKLRLAYVNHIAASATVVTALTSATKFPVARLQSAFRQVRWRSTGIVSEYVQFDFGSAQIVQCLFILDHNLTGEAMVELRGSTDGFVASDEVLGVFTPASDPLVEYIDTTQFRYYRLTFADPTNLDGYIEVGRIHMGPYYEAKRNFNHGYAMGAADLSETVTSRNGVDSHNRKPQKRTAVLPFEHMEYAQKEEFRYLWETVGTHTPFFASINYDENPIAETLYCKLQSMPVMVDTVIRLYDTTLSLIEAL